MKTMILHGYMAERFGESFCMDVKNPGEFLRALGAQLKGFDKAIAEGSWHIVRGDLESAGFDDSETLETLEIGMAKDSIIHLLPAMEGAGNNGVFTTILGVALIAIGYFTFGTTSAYGVALIAGGAGLVVSGIVSMTTKMPGVDSTNKEGPESRASFLLNGPRNQSTQGVTIPRGYGRAIVGSIVISAAIYAERLPV